MCDQQLNVTLDAVDVLLVENDPDDVRSIRKLFVDRKLGNRLSIVPDGVAALRLLRGQAPYQHAPRPGLILLNLDPAHDDGQKLLVEIKDDPVLGRVPVVALTTSTTADDGPYRLGRRPDAYVAKPVEFEKLVAAVGDIDGLFITLCGLPGP